MDRNVGRQFYFLIVDHNDCLLYDQDFCSAPKRDADSLHLMQLIAHASLDVVDELAAQQPSMLLKNVDKFNEWTVSAFVLTSGVRFLLLHTVRSDDAIRNFFTEVYEMFIKLSMNPLHETGRPIRCQQFDNKMFTVVIRSPALAMDKYLNGEDHSSSDADKIIASFEKLTPGPDCSSLMKMNYADLRLSYDPRALPKGLAYVLLRYCERKLRYFDGALSQVKVFDRWHPVPRKQTVMGDPGLSYAFSGIRLPTLQWDPVVKALRDYVARCANCSFNFVLINRYADGNDHIGEHRDDERELDPDAPIASVSLGEARDFVFKHQKRRKGLTDAPPVVKLNLRSGSLLIMHPPTNRRWYHSLPKRRRSLGVRLNFTFRKLQTNS